MSQPASSQAEIEELESELAFQSVLLRSIDDTVEKRSNVEDEVRAEIKSIEKKLRALRKQGTMSSASRPALLITFTFTFHYEPELFHLTLDLH
jgi:uncharacterized coiled-coil protein SlyX